MGEGQQILSSVKKSLLKNSTQEWPNILFFHEKKKEESVNPLHTDKILIHLQIIYHIAYKLWGHSPMLYFLIKLGVPQLKS